MVAACLSGQSMRMPGWPRRHWWLLALFGNPCECRGGHAGIGEPPTCKSVFQRSYLIWLLTYLLTLLTYLTFLIWKPTRTTDLQVGGSEKLPYLAAYLLTHLLTYLPYLTYLIWQPTRTTDLQVGVPSGKPQPPNRLTIMRGPEVAKVSRRCIASKSAARLFSGAHTPASPPEPHCRAGVICTSPMPASPVLRPAEPSILGSFPV